MNDQQEILELKARIARVFKQREDLKAALERGEISASRGFAQLEQVDLELSGLDSRFKTLWDAARPRNKETTP